MNWFIKLQGRGTLEDCDNLALDTAKAWNAMQLKDPWAALYLWHQPGALAIATERPAGFELSTPARLGPSATVEQMSNYLRPIVYKLPILTP